MKIVVSVKRLHLNVQLYVSVKKSAHIIEFRRSKQKSVENISHLIGTIIYVFEAVVLN